MFRAGRIGHSFYTCFLVYIETAFRPDSFFQPLPLFTLAFFLGLFFFLVDLTLTSSRGSHSMHMFASC